MEMGSNDTGITHPLIQEINNRRPKTIAISIDGVKVFKAKFTENGLETLYDLHVDPNIQKDEIAFFLDDDLKPFYSFRLKGETE